MLKGYMATWNPPLRVYGFSVAWPLCRRRVDGYLRQLYGDASGVFSGRNPFARAGRQAEAGLRRATGDGRQAGKGKLGSAGNYGKSMAHGSSTYIPIHPWMADGK